MATQARSLMAASREVPKVVVSPAPASIVKRSTSVNSTRSIDSKLSVNSTKSVGSKGPKAKSRLRPAEVANQAPADDAQGYLSAPRADSKEILPKRVSFGKGEDDLSPDEIRLVAESWEQAKSFPWESLGWMLFANFFKIAERAKGLFPRIFDVEDETAVNRGVKLHGVRVIDALDTVVRMLKDESDQSRAANFLRMVGLRHVGYKADPEDFDVLGQAFIKTVCTTSGGELPGDTVSAWQKFWTFVTASTLGAYKRLPGQAGIAAQGKSRSSAGSSLRPRTDQLRFKIDDNAISTLESIQIDDIKDITSPTKKKTTEHAVGFC